MRTATMIAEPETLKKVNELIDSNDFFASKIHNTGAKTYDFDDETWLKQMSGLDEDIAINAFFQQLNREMAAKNLWAFIGCE